MAKPQTPRSMRAMAPTGKPISGSQPSLVAWNVGDVLVPEEAPWLDDFLSEVCGFTGVNDSHDDQIDAGGAAFDLLAPFREERTPPAVAVGSDEWALAQERAMEAAAEERLERAKEAEEWGEGW
jgi:hypothetical protein